MGLDQQRDRCWRVVPSWRPQHLSNSSMIWRTMLTEATGTPRSPSRQRGRDRPPSMSVLYVVDLGPSGAAMSPSIP